MKYKNFMAGNSPEAVSDLLVGAGLGRDFVGARTKLIKGFFDDTLPKYSRKIALLHIDKYYFIKKES